MFGASASHAHAPCARGSPLRGSPLSHFAPATRRKNTNSHLLLRFGLYTAGSLPARVSREKLGCDYQRIRVEIWWGCCADEHFMSGVCSTLRRPKNVSGRVWSTIKDRRNVDVLHRFMTRSASSWCHFRVKLRWSDLTFLTQKTWKKGCLPPPTQPSDSRMRPAGINSRLRLLRQRALTSGTRNATQSARVSSWISFRRQKDSTI